MINKSDNISAGVPDKDKSAQETELKILAAAEREFIEKGFAGARTISIAESAGVTHAMLHYYFRTKEKLFDRIIADKITLLKGAIMNSIRGELSLDEFIKRIIDTHLDFLADNPGIPRLLMGELYSGSDMEQKVLERISQYSPVIISTLQEKIDKAAGEGLCRRVDARMLILDIVCLNIFPFPVMPVVNSLLEGCMTDLKAFVELRKAENYDTIMRKIASLPWKMEREFTQLSGDNVR